LACSSIIEGTTMDQYAGIDVSLESASVCVVDSTGRIVREAKVACEPEALIAALFLPNGATTPRTRGDRDKVAVHAVSCETRLRFPVYQANIREFIANLVLVWQNPAANRLLFK
jgi:hypothetical protein